MVETYEKFLPLSKEHQIYTSFIDSTIIVTSDGAPIALSLTGLILHESHTITDAPNLKVYDNIIYLHPDCINWNLLKKSDKVTYCSFKGYAVYYSLPGKENVAWCYERPYEQISEIAGLIAFYADKVDITITPDYGRLTTNDRHQDHSTACHSTGERRNVNRKEINYI